MNLLLAAVLERWIEDCKSSDPVIKRRALTDFQLAAPNPASNIWIEWAARLTGNTPNAVLRNMVHRARENKRPQFYILKQKHGFQEPVNRAS
jgi:hypothetical protein